MLEERACFCVNREEMLKVLSGIDFRFVWPGNWEDIDFTERPIWINKNGYGYISCDEPCGNWELRSFTDEKWHEIRDKLERGSLTADDLVGSSFEDETWIWESINDSDDVCKLLKGLKNLPDKLDESFYCVSTFDGYDFFASYEEFKESFKRDDCDYEWKELSDDVLKLWIERLNAGELEGDLILD